MTVTALKRKMRLLLSGMMRWNDVTANVVVPKTVSTSEGDKESNRVGEDERKVEKKERRCIRE